MENLVWLDLKRGRGRFPPRRPRARRRLSDTAALKLCTVAACLALGLVAIVNELGIVPSTFVSQNGGIGVIDGDTVLSGGHIYRLVGFNTPEAGLSARCWRERELASKATARLRELLASGDARLVRVACACQPGTEGTHACNHGRRCGRLAVSGREVGPVLIGEGLAERYHCRATTCPRRKNWCAA